MEWKGNNREFKVPEELKSGTTLGIYSWTRYKIALSLK